jgi:peptidoglycan/LPS O-acetylase OafA/YrhL
MWCDVKTPARRRYERDVVRFMVAYVVVVLCSAWFVKHDGHEKFYLYFWSLFPALPVLGVLYRMGRYLREETDEYQRWLVMQSILVGTAALIGTMVVSDFLRSFAGVGELPPFVGFVIFAAGMAGAQIVQRIRNRSSDE